MASLVRHKRPSNTGNQNPFLIEQTPEVCSCRRFRTLRSLLLELKLKLKLKSFFILSMKSFFLLSVIIQSHFVEFVKCFLVTNW